MKFNLGIALLSIILFLIPQFLFSQGSSTTTSIGIDAKVIAPITIINVGNQNLNFGTITRSSVAGTVTVTSGGQRTYTGGVSVLSSSLFTAAPFSVSGENSAGFNLTLPDNDDVKMTRTGGTEEMEVTSFTHNSGLVLSSSGTTTFSVGATLNLDADQVAGDYTGSFNVTIAYQ